MPKYIFCFFTAIDYLLSIQQIERCQTANTSKLLTETPLYDTFLLFNKIGVLPTFLAASRLPLLSSI